MMQELYCVEVQLKWRKSVGVSINEGMPEKAWHHLVEDEKLYPTTIITPFNST